MRLGQNFQEGVENLFRIFEVHNEKIYIVGGYVRDMLLGITSRDIDFATSLVVEDVINILESNNIKVNIKGKRFGSVSAEIGNNKYDITTFRQDIYMGSRFPRIKFIKDIEVDSCRRDFTMNAIYLNLEGGVYDFHNGVSDIKEGIVKFIGIPDVSIGEDPLRLLRYFRFCAYYFYERFDEVSLSSAISNFTKIQTIPKNKVMVELDKIFNAPQKNIILDIWRKNGILKYINEFKKDI